MESDRPNPTRKDKRGGEVKNDELIDTLKQLASEVEGLKKQVGERIPLPPTAYNDSQDMYVSQGIHQYGTPEITDPEVRREYGLDKDEFENELPPSAPQRRADVMQGIDPNIDPNNEDEMAKVQKREDSMVDGDAYQGGTQIGGGINDSSDGTYKDPYDLDNTIKPELEIPLTDMKNIGPRQPPVVKERDYKRELANETEEEEEEKAKANQPIAPSEMDPRDNDKTSSQDIQNIDVEDDQERDDFEEEDNDPELPKNDPSGIDEEERVELNNGSFREEEVPTNGESPLEIPNDDSPLVDDQDKPAGSISGLDDAVIGDSSQYRLKKDELGLEDPEPEQYNDVLDNTGLNMKPDGTNDGMVYMPEDRQQIDPDNPFDPQNNNVQYTDQTDEQGNQIPDLRFDQTQNSEEEQPEIEREHEIVTQDDFEKEEDLADVASIQEPIPEMPEQPMGQDLDQQPQVDFEIPEIPDTLLPDGQEEAEEDVSVSGPPAGTTMVANNQYEEPDVLPDGKVVDGKKWKTKTGEKKKKTKRKRK